MAVEQNSEAGQSEAQGYALSVGASIFFVCVPLYVQWLTAISGMTMLLHRAYWQFIVLLLVCLISRRDKLIAIFSDRRQLLVHLLTAPLIGVQWWLFIWAPVVDRTIDLAIGYLILPVTLVLAGVIVLSESVSRLKLAAIFAALCGLLLELWISGSISWISAVVFIGYPPYFLLHRIFRTRSSFSSLCVESGLVMLAMLIWMSLSPGAVIVPTGLATNGLLVGLGLLSLVGMLCYLGASKKLPLNVFGLLSYMEPILLFAAAIIFLGETVGQQKYLSYGCFAFSLLLVVYEGIKKLSGKR